MSQSSEMSVLTKGLASGTEELMTCLAVWLQSWLTSWAPVISPLKLKEKYSEKAECYICSNAGILVLWWFIGYFAYGQEKQIALRCHRGMHMGSNSGQCQFWKVRQCRLRVKLPLCKDPSSRGSTNFLHLAKYSLLRQRDMQRFVWSQAAPGWAVV